MLTDVYTVALPIVVRNDPTHRQCSLDSPFGIEIARLHKVVPGGSQVQTDRPLTEAEWLSLYEESFPTLIQALRDSGACWTRVNIHWSWIQPEPPEEGQPPDYLWGPYHDEKLALVAETGVHLIAVVEHAPDWAADSPCDNIYVDRLDEFAQFLTDLVNRYKQPPYNIHHWELRNEPDGTWSSWGGGCGGLRGDRYAQMLSMAYPAIKAADPEATVLMGGLAYDWFTEYGGPFNRYFADDVMDAGGDDYLDAINFHYFPDFHAEWERWVPEGDPPTCGIVDDGAGAPYEAWGIDVIAKANHFRNRMKTCFGVDKPLWVTELAEHGYPDDPDSMAQQARYVIQGYARALAAGAQNITWFSLESVDFHEQGLLNLDLTPKPAYYAYQTLTSELAGYRYSHTLGISEGEAYIFRNADQKEKTVAWGFGVLTFTPASRLRVVDREGSVTLIEDGGAGDLDGAQNGVVSLQLTDEPVFVSKQ